jgi:hypothetical protein
MSRVTLAVIAQAPAAAMLISPIGCVVTAAIGTAAAAEGTTPSISGEAAEAI